MKIVMEKTQHRSLHHSYLRMWRCHHPSAIPYLTTQCWSWIRFLVTQHDGSGGELKKNVFVLFELRNPIFGWASDPNLACLVYIWVYPTSLLHPNHNTQHPNRCNIRSYQKRSTKKRQRTTSPSTLQPALHLQRRWVYNPSGPDASEISLALDTEAAVWAEKRGEHLE